MRNFERSLKNLLKHLTNIFAKILQDPQGFDQDLAKIPGKIQTGSLLGSFKILEDSIRIFEKFVRLIPRGVQCETLRAQQPVS